MTPAMLLSAAVQGRLNCTWSWPYTVRLPHGRRDHRARQRSDGKYETACPGGGIFPAGAGHLTRPLCYRTCQACARALAGTTRVT
jgi:hypothetical protein